jgi:enoyl-CoA hydratase/carnithine racemase
MTEPEGRRYGDLRVDVDAGVATLTIDRPEALNALRIQTFEELERGLREADSNPSVGVVVIAGSKESKAFCAGGDVRMATELTTTAAIREHYFHRMQRLSWLVVNSGKPVICAVGGPAIGGGAELSLFCDFVIASEDAYFSFNGTEIGGSCWWGAAQLLPVMVGLRAAEDILYTSRRVGAPEAAKLGLISAAVPAASLDRAVSERCELLLERSEEGIRLTKAALRATKEILLATMATSAEQAVAAHEGSDVIAAFDAFLAGGRIDWRARRGIVRAD